MRVVAHISDLHFGAEEIEPGEGLLASLDAMQPALVIISGDLTQRARRGQFAAAREYLKRIPFPKLVIPGNHDVPLYDVFRRFLSPLGRYREYINAVLDPWYDDEELAVLGLNTARSLTWKSGRISMEQIAKLERRFARLPDSKFKILVTHHPFIPPPGEEAAGVDLVGRAHEAIEVIDRCCVDLLLSGHLHHGYSGDIRTYYPKARRSVVVVQAGTAISHRVRGEPNAFNRLVLDGNWIGIEVRVWNGRRYEAARRTEYRLEGSEWRVGNGGFKYEI